MAFALFGEDKSIIFPSSEGIFRCHLSRWRLRGPGVPESPAIPCPESERPVLCFGGL